MCSITGVTATPTVLAYHGVDDVTGNRAVTPVIEHTHILPGHPRLAGKLQTHLVIHGQRAHGHADRLTEVIDLDWVNTFGQQSNAFIKVSSEGARREEAQ